MAAFRFLCVLCVLCGGEFALAQSPITLTVQETAGIRRMQFPVMARMPLAQGALRDVSHARLLMGMTVVPAQFTADTRWPDGSIRDLVADFNASPAPNETQTYTLQYGDAITAEAPARGLMVTEEADAIQVGNVRFARSGVPLITSVTYRDEAIGAGVNGLLVIDGAGAVHDLSSARELKVEVIKAGPLVAAVRYSGLLPLDAASARPLDASNALPFTLVAEVPSSKSWVKITAHVDDPTRKVKEIAVATPFGLGSLPWTWDFGTSRWTYGSLRAPADSVVLTSTPGERPAWSVASGAKGREQPFELASEAAPLFAGWGHLQGGKEVVAFAIDHAPEWTGTTRVTIDGSGQARFSLAPAKPAPRHDITVYEHFVATPVQIGAATSPAAILNPLVVSVRRVIY